MEWLEKKPDSQGAVDPDIGGEKSGDAVSPNVEWDFGAMILAALAEAPERRAFRFQDQDLTRAELREETLLLARRLNEAGVLPGALVAIEIEHSLELVVAMCAVQVAGACAVPVDPDIAGARRDAILADIGPTVILRRGAAQDDGGRVFIAIDRGETLDAQKLSGNPHLAFIVYTSGTSGGPKGVMISKESYVRRMEHIVPSIVFGDDDLDLAWTPSSFIVMVDEFFLPLLAGLPAIIADPVIRTDAQAFMDLVRKEKITTFRITPSLLNFVLRTNGAAEAFAHVRTLICSGEAMSTDLQMMVKEKLSARLLGFYGSTEAPGAAFQPYDDVDAPFETTICTPQPFLAMRIASEDGNETSLGETGEVWIGGCAVAAGYWNKPELSAGKFVNLDGERWYRTGDKGRQLEDGRFEILGRIDLSEVKINGVRINLPEICHALRTNKTVTDAWVSAIEPIGGGDPVLVAHCVTGDARGFDAAALRDALADQLSAAAIPRFIMRHEQFPLTANGKLDAQNLARDAAAFVKAPSEGASTDDNADTRPVYLQELEAHLTEVWRDVLDNPEIGLDSDFFAYGGTSLLAGKLNTAIEKAFGVRPPLNTVFEAPTVRQFVLRLKTEAGEGGAVLLAPTDLGEAAPALFMLHGLFVYRDLANQLIETANTYGVYLEEEAQSENLPGHENVKDAKHLAARYAEQILRIRPQGPYYLAGLSRGGLIALDTANLLRDMGHEIGLVALLDTNAPQTPWRARIGRAKKLLRSLAGRGGKNFAGEDITAALYRDAHHRFATSPYPGDIAVLRAETSDFGTRREDLGWSNYVTGKVSVNSVPGDHLGILKPPNVDLLAAHLSGYMAKHSDR